VPQHEKKLGRKLSTTIDDDRQRERSNQEEQEQEDKSRSDEMSDEQIENDSHGGVLFKIPCLYLLGRYTFTYY
jgi:hypothetical protein